MRKHLIAFMLTAFVLVASAALPTQEVKSSVPALPERQR